MARSPSRWDFKSYFLGPKGELACILKEAINLVLQHHREARCKLAEYMGVELYPEPSFDEELMNEVKSVLEELGEILLWGKEGYEEGVGTPIFESHYIAHMLTDPLWIAIVGKLAGDLWNQNNVVYEVSVKTTMLEREVISVLARALAGWDTLYMEEPNPGEPKAFGRLTSGGSIANLEAMWLAREKAHLAGVLAEKIRKEEGECFKDFWNIIWENTKKKKNLSFYDYVKKLEEESINKKGFVGDKKSLVFFVSKHKHYSIEKSAYLLGIGSNLKEVDVDENKRMNIEDLKKKLKSSLNKGKVACVIATLGTTEFCSFDPLDEIVELREKLYKENGCWFHIHADAAWGGAFALLVDEKEEGGNKILSPEVENALKAMKDADTITIDPHKLFFIPYPAGAIIYRDWRDTQLISTHAPYLFHGKISQRSQGVASVEGSKPGSTPTAVWAAFRFMTSDKSKPLRKLPRERLLDRYKPILIHGIKTTRKLHKMLQSINIENIKIELIPKDEPQGNILTFKIGKSKKVSKKVYEKIVEPFLWKKRHENTTSKFMVSFEEEGVIRVAPINPYITDDVLKRFTEFLKEKIKEAGSEVYQR